MASLETPYSRLIIIARVEGEIDVFDFGQVGVPESAYSYVLATTQVGLRFVLEVHVAVLMYAFFVAGFDWEMHKLRPKTAFASQDACSDPSDYPF